MIPTPPEAGALPHILIVDDDEIPRRLLERLVQQEGLATTVVNSGELALAWLAEHEVDLMIMDLTMTGISGEELIETIMRSDHQVPFIVVTGRNDHKAAVDMMKLGALDFLTKDELNRATLGAAVRRALNRIGQQRQIDLAQAEQRRLTAQLEEERRRLADLLATVPGIVWENLQGQSGRGCYVSAYVEPMLGYTVEEWQAQPQMWMHIMHPDDLAMVIAEKDAILAGQGHEVSRFRLLAKDGRVVWAASHIVPIRDAEDRIVGLRGVTTDITTRHWVELRRHFELAVTGAFSRANTLATAAVPIATAVCQACGWTLGELWRVDPEAKVLRYSAGWHPDDVALADFEAASRRTTFVAGVGLPGLAWESGQPLWMDGFAGDSRLAQTAASAVPAKLRSAFAYPILFQDNVLGVFVFYAPNIREASQPDVLQMFELLGGQIAQFIQRRRAERDRLRLEREILEIADAEQRRIGHDLHDDLCQRLVGVQLISHALCDDLTRDGSPRAAAVAAIANHLGVAVVHARNLARGLSPVDMDAQGLMTALQKLADDSAALFRVDCVFQCPALVTMDIPATATHLYRIAQEAITNAVRHGRARRVVVSLSAESGHGVLEVTDNGSGIDDHAPAGMGLRTMRYRANVIGATIEVRSVEGGGSCIRCIFPKS